MILIPLFGNVLRRSTPELASPSDDFGISRFGQYACGNVRSANEE